MEYSDDGLIDLIRENDDEALRIMFEKYMPLIRKKANKAHIYLANKGYDKDDLIQEIMIHFEEIIRSYKEGTVLFYTFASSCIDKKLYSLIKLSKNDKHKALNEAISYDNYNDDEISLIEFIKEEDSNPLIGVISSENEQELYYKIKNTLTDIEIAVFELRLQGLNYKEIAEILEKEPKVVDNALTRIRIKVRKVIEENEVLIY